MEKGIIVQCATENGVYITKIRVFKEDAELSMIQEFDGLGSAADFIIEKREQH